LQVLRGVEEEAHCRADEEHARRVGCRAFAAGKQAQGQDGLFGAALDLQEQHQQHDARAQRGGRATVQPERRTEIASRCPRGESK